MSALPPVAGGTTPELAHDLRTRDEQDVWRRRARRALFVVSPRDQPAWARPALLVLTGLASFLYAWSSSGYLEIYYAAAVRSMSANWHNFLYAAFDPAGTISTDKLPGAFWVQALSVRLFGLHDWAIVLPQIVEGALTVLVLYRAVRRLAGPVAGIAAAAVLAVAPANVTLNRGNISDTLMILFAVLAADAVVGAVVSGRWRNLLLGGLWVGLAFQAKMVEAWLILPALAVVYFIAGPPGRLRRVVGIGALAVVAVAVSLSWMLYVSAQPTAGRPYVDGSAHDSVFEQVFDYNGFGRLSQPSPNAVLFETIGIGGLASTPPGWDRMVVGVFGTDTGWLIPASLLGLVAGLVATRRRPRTDRLRASLVLWGTWLIVLAATFSASTTINSYYTAALTPAIAGLVGTSVALAWEHRRAALTRVLVAVGIAGSGVYAAWLLPAAGVGLYGWLGPCTLAAAALAALVAVASLRFRPVPVLAVALGLGLGAGLVVPAVGSAGAVANGMGSFDTPFEPAAYAASMQRLFGPATRESGTGLLPLLEHLRSQFHTRDLMATQTAVVAAPAIFASGQEVYPLGGYDGTGVAPTLTRLRRLIADGYFRLVLANPSSKDPRYRWIAHHCLAPRGSMRLGGIGVYFCLPGAH
jgi:4-amino-4-deoxy-L-arabinose transferase-like glycosyltransferase